MESYIFIVISSLIVYLFIISAIRIFGKREISQLSVIDLVFILLISNAVQNAMVGGDIGYLIGGLVAAVTLFVANYFLGELFYKSKAFSKLVQGEPLMLVYEGKIIKKHLEKAKISEDELEAATREHGVAGVTDVNLAVLERDGNISVLSDDYKHKTKEKREINKILKNGD
jgi:uncharacterized membrane protein YcaP (DUF421 family)